MEKIEIKWLKSSSTSNIGQIYSSGLEYCFISKNMEQCHALIYCKDFLQDAVQAHLHGKSASIYGFTYNPKTKPPIDLEKTRIALVNKSDDKFAEKIPHLLDFLNQFAKKLHLKPTRVLEVSNPPKRYSGCGVFVTEGSPRWMNSPPLISMYSLLLRCGCAHTAGNDAMKTIKSIINGTIKPYQSSDSSQLRSALNGIEKIVKMGYRPFFYIENAKNYPKDIDIDTMHNMGGIVGFSSGGTEDICPYWHRKSLAKRLGSKSS